MLRDELADLLNDLWRDWEHSDTDEAYGPWAAARIIAHLGLTQGTKYGIENLDTGLVVTFGPREPDQEDVKRFGGPQGVVVQRALYSGVSPWLPVSSTEPT